MNLKSAFCFLILTLLTSHSFAFQANRISDQVEILSKLTGHEAIKPGVVLKDRFAQESREIAAQYLKAQLAAFCQESVIENYSPTGNNVVGTILATSDTDQWVILGAHYDSVRDCPGANDNASGVALTYSVANYITLLFYRRHYLKTNLFNKVKHSLIKSKDYPRRLLD